MINRLAQESDIDSILNIITQAQKYLKEAGVNQWQNGYPNRTSIEQDIEGKKAYVLEREGKILATAALSFNDECTYDVIYEGKWLSEGSYGVIHRVAVAQNYKGEGIAGRFFAQLEEICKEQGAKSIKIDTHEDNQSMQRLLKKLGFTDCGIIFLKDGNKRIAFEKLLVCEEK